MRQNIIHLLKTADAITREKIVLSIKSQSLLKEIATEDKNSLVRAMAIRKIIDINLLATIADNDPVEWVRKEAVEKLKSIIYPSFIGESAEG